MLKGFAKIPNIQDMGIPFGCRIFRVSKQFPVWSHIKCKDLPPWAQLVIELGIMEAARLARSGSSAAFEAVLAAKINGAEPARLEK